MGDDITIGVTEIVNNIEVTAQPNDQIVDISVTDNSDEVTLNITPTVVEVNINKGGSFAKWGDLYGTLSDQTDLQNALNLKANLVGGKVPASELPSYVDDIIEVANYAALPATGEIGKIYVTLDNNKIYRWSGSVYIEIASNSAIWGAITGTLGDQTDLQNALNAKQAALSGTGFVKISGTTISYDNTTYLSGTVAIANGGTGATTAGGALTNLGATTVGANILTSTNPSPVTTAYLKVKPDNSVEWLEANAFRIAIGAGTGNGTVTSVEAVGGYGGLTLTGTVTGSGQLTLGGTPTGTWPISITGNAASVNTVQVSTNADFYLTFADANNGSPTSEFLYTIGTIKVNPSTGALTASSFVKSGGTSSQFLMADGSVSTGSGGTVTSVAAITLGTTGTDLSSTVANGTTTPVITLNVPTASATNRGALSAADWTTFNSKQNALTNPVTGTGTSGHVAFWNGTSSITGESNLFWDSTNDRLGIGTAIPLSRLHIDSLNTATDTVGNVFISASDSLAANIGGQLTLGGLYNGSSKYAFGGIAARKENATSGNVAGYLSLMSTTSAGALTERMRINSSGQIEVKGTSTATNAQALITNSDTDFNIYASNASGVNKNINFLFNGGSGQAMRITSNGNVGIGTTSPTSGISSTETTLQIQNGNVAALALNNSSSRKYAIYSGVGGQLGFYDSTADAERMRISSGGNVGIGTTSPVNPLTVQSNGSAQAIAILNRSSDDFSNLLFYNYAGSSVLGGIGNSSGRIRIMTGGVGDTYERLSITSSGNVGIGTTSPNRKLTVNGTIGLSDDLVSTSGGTTFRIGYQAYTATGGYNLFTESTIPLVFGTASTENMRITPSGNVLIGTTTDAGAKLQVNGYSTLGGALNSTWAVGVSNTGTTDAHGMYVNIGASSTGVPFAVYKNFSALFTVANSGAATFSSTVTASGGFFNSDIRLKDLTDYDYNVSDIKPITYLWKDGRDNKKHVGYSAQEVQKVMPDAVNEDEKGFLSVNYVEVLVAKIAELENRIKQLEK